MTDTLKPVQRAYIGSAMCAALFGEAQQGSSRSEAREALVKTMEIAFEIREKMGEEDKRESLTNFVLDMFDILWPDEEQD